MISMVSSPTASNSKPSNEISSTTFFGCFSINARSDRFKRFYLCQMICFPFIPILALFVQNLAIFLEQKKAYDEAREINQQVATNEKFVVAN